MPAITVALLAFKNNTAIIKNNPGIYTDSTIITHVLDGKVDEWPSAKFEQDKDTHIKFAIDNDGQNLYVALIIPSFPTQAKMMRQGMNMYVDIKGKKKEGRGVEFPVKNESVNSGFRMANQSEGSFDKQAFRSAMALSLINLKLFGFSNADGERQALNNPASLNIQFSFDGADVMYIEYNIPLSLLEVKPAEMNQKMISLGWKINGADASNQTTTTETPIVGRSSNGRQTNSRTPQNTNKPNFDEAAMREQSFWTKYTMLVH